MPPSPPRSRANGRVTLADVAGLAKVSPITVSSALRSEHPVDPELSARVKAAADRLGDVPDPAARAPASLHSAHVALLIPPLTKVRTPRAPFGTAAAGMLRSLMRGEPAPVSVVDLGYEVVVRQSTGSRVAAEPAKCRRSG
jgi:DNA-binding LacI/PurR family transcriptional regulator